MRFRDRYIFQGHAVGFEAHIREPQDQICWIKGAMALPVTGGYGKQELGPDQCLVPSRNSRYSFESVAVFASGDFLENRGQRAYPDWPARTVTAAYLNKLNILDRVSFNTLAAHLVLDDLTEEDQPAIRFGTINPISGAPDPVDPIAGLSIDGLQVDIEFDRTFWKLTTRDEIAEACDSDDRIIETSIVKRLSWARGEAKGVTFEDNTIQLDGFGRIHLGEFLVGERARQLTLVRVQLGADERGNDCGGDIVSGPLPWPAD